MALLTMAENHRGGLDVLFTSKSYQTGDESTLWASTTINEFDNMLNDWGYNVTTIGFDALNGSSSFRDYMSVTQAALNNGKVVFLYVNSPHLKSNKWWKNRTGTHFMRLNSITPRPKEWWQTQMYDVNLWDYGHDDFYPMSRNKFNTVTYGISTQ